MNNLHTSLINAGYDYFGMRDANRIAGRYRGTDVTVSLDQYQTYVVSYLRRNDGTDSSKFMHTKDPNHVQQLVKWVQDDINDRGYAPGGA